MNLSAFLVGCGVVATSVAACESPSVCDDGECGALDAGTDAPGTCDPSADASCISDEKGVFVSPVGDDTSGAGTKASPVKSLTRALERAGATKRLIFMCEGEYKDPSEVLIDRDLSIYGGLSCPAWALPTSSAKAKLHLDTPGIVVSVRAVHVVLSDLEITAKDAQGPGASSIAVRVARGEATLRRVSVIAGKGVDGAAGLKPTTILPASVRGNDAPETGTAGAEPPTCAVCPAGASSSGGQGGAGGAAPSDGANGGPGATENKGRNTGPSSCSPGTKGADAPSASVGNGAANLGSVTDDGSWQPASGTKGTPGNPGQGGGGGGGISGAGNGGGSGGCGGCGGDAGGAGGGGGGSIAILALDATVTLQNSSLQSAQAGNGGSGAEGQAGAAGGARGNQSGTGNGCDAGPGGAGGAGGPGGGGAGGVSVGVLWRGRAPTIDPATMNAIKPAARGARGAGPAGNSGIDGQAAPVLEAPR